MNFIAFVSFRPGGQKLLKSWNLIFFKKEKFVCICYSLNNNSTTMRKNDWMVITFEETPTNIWELVLLLFCWLFFFTNSYTSILKLISSINFIV